MPSSGATRSVPRSLVATVPEDWQSLIFTPTSRAKVFTIFSTYKSPLVICARWRCVVFYLKPLFATSANCSWSYRGQFSYAEAKAMERKQKRTINKPTDPLFSHILRIVPQNCCVKRLGCLLGVNVGRLKSEVSLGARVHHTGAHSTTRPPMTDIRLASILR